MTSEVRRVQGRPRSEEAQRAILVATLAILAEAGISGLTVEGVAARAGVGKATIYRRWTSKLPLAVDAILTLPELRAPASGTLRGDLKRILGSLARILRSSPLGRVLAHLAAEYGLDADLDAAVAPFLRARRAPIVEVVRRGLERGDLSTTADAEALTDLLVGPIVNRLLFSRRPADGRFIDLTIEAVLEGVPGRRAGSARRGDFVAPPSGRLAGRRAAGPAHVPRRGAGR